MTQDGPVPPPGTGGPAGAGPSPLPLAEPVRRAPRPEPARSGGGVGRVAARVALVAVGLVVLFLGAFAVDSWLHRDQVARNTLLAGQPVGGMDRAQLDRAVDRLARQLPDTDVTIDTAEFTIDTDAGDLGLGIDRAATRDLVWSVGRGDGLLGRPLAWASSLVTPRESDVRLEVDEDQLDPGLRFLEGGRRTAPVEPSITAQEGGVALVAGTPGRSLTTESVRAALPEQLGDISRPIRLRVERTVVPPRIPDAEVQALVDRANAVTGGDITLRAGSQTFEIPGADLRPAFAVAVDEPADGAAPAARLTVDPDRVAELLERRAPAGSRNPTGVRFTISGGVPQPVAGQDAQVCCGPDAPEALVAALLEGRTEVDLPTRTVTAAEGVAWAQTLGVREVVGQFTTNHPAGQPRVQNIHTISDATRGVLIAPGDTFSVNSFVGPRTTAKGYVSAPVIENGEFTEGVGGGVSQYATTLFNAAFFAGLDIPAYKAHSKYISRYPYGREATLAYPGVDLKIRNETPYGVVIWPTYTASSISVQLWSTRHATGAQTGQNRSSGCGRVVTERTVTYTDGRTETDDFVANYDCD